MPQKWQYQPTSLGKASKKGKKFKHWSQIGQFSLILCSHWLKTYFVDMTWHSQHHVYLNSNWDYHSIIAGFVIGFIVNLNLCTFYANWINVSILAAIFILKSLQVAFSLNMVTINDLHELMPCSCLICLMPDQVTEMYSRIFYKQ